MSKGQLLLEDLSKPFQLFTLYSIFFPSEKKKEKEREELWKKLEDLELKRGLRRDGIIPT